MLRAAATFALALLASCAHAALATAPPDGAPRDAAPLALAAPPPVVRLPDAGVCPVRGVSAEELLARVGEEALTPCDLALGALARTVDGEGPATPRALYERALAELLEAREARARGLDREPSTRRRLDATLAAALLRSLARAESNEEADLARYYEEHRAEFTEPERVRLRAIVLDTRAEATALLAALQQPDADAAAAARERNTVASLRRDSGDLGLCPEGGNDRVPEALARAGFALAQVGAWHPEPLERVTQEPRGRRHRLVPVRHYWLVQLLERAPARVRPLEEVAPVLRRRLALGGFAASRARQRAALEASVQERRREVHLDEAALRSLHLQLPPEPPPPPPSRRGARRR